MYAPISYLSIIALFLFQLPLLVISLPCQIAFPRYGDIHRIIPHSNSSLSEIGIYSVIVCKISEELKRDSNKRNSLQMKAIWRSVLDDKQLGIATYSFDVIDPRQVLESTIKMFASPGVIQIAADIYICIDILFESCSLTASMSTSIYALAYPLTSLEASFPAFQREKLQGFTNRNLDFIEVGTSAFETILQIARPEHVGLSIEPISALQEMLPERENVLKINCAIGDKDGWVDMYSVPPDVLNALGMTMESHISLYGTARIGVANPDLLLVTRKQAAHDPTVLFSRSLVATRRLQDILQYLQVDQIGVLKVDCEGKDYEILLSLIPFFAQRRAFPCIVEYEVDMNSVLRESMISTQKEMTNAGYEVMFLSYGTFLPSGGIELNMVDAYAVHKSCANNSDWLSEYSYMTPMLENVIRACTSELAVGFRGSFGPSLESCVILNDMNSKAWQIMDPTFLVNFGW